MRITGNLGTIAAATLSLLACGSAPSEAGGTLASRPAFREGPPLSTPRATHAQVRTDRAILLIGGCVRDGCEAGPASGTVDIIPMAGDAGRETGTLIESRVQPDAAPLPGGKALILGGWVEGSVAASTEIFDPATRISRPGPAMALPRTAASVTALDDGRVLIVGGHDGGRVTASAEIYDPGTGRMERTGDLDTARMGATATLLADGYVLIVGGAVGPRQGDRVLASAELYDPATGTFSPAGDLAQRRYKHGAVALPSGDVLIVGGSDERDYDGKLRSVERYDVDRGGFVAAGSLSEPRFKLANSIVLLSTGEVLVAGGGVHPELFDPATGVGRLLKADLGGQWNYLTAAGLGGDRVLLAGGYSEGTIRVSDRNWVLRL